MTVLSLRGFWRACEGSVGSGLGLLPGALLLVGVLVVVGLGFRSRWGDEPDRLHPAGGRSPSLGLLLGAGVSGPLAGLYRVAFDVLPLFEAMREQQKWLALAVLGYAVGFGCGVEWLAQRPQPWCSRWWPGRSRCSWRPGWSGASAARSAPVSTPRAGRRRGGDGRRARAASCSCRGTPTSRSTSPTAGPWPRPRRRSSPGRPGQRRGRAARAAHRLDLPAHGVRGPDRRRRRAPTRSARCWPRSASSTWPSPRASGGPRTRTGWRSSPGSSW